MAAHFHPGIAAAPCVSAPPGSPYPDLSACASSDNTSLVSTSVNRSARIALTYACSYLLHSISFSFLAVLLFRCCELPSCFTITLNLIHNLVLIHILTRHHVAIVHCRTRVVVHWMPVVQRLPRVTGAFCDCCAQSCAGDVHRGDGRGGLRGS